MTFVGFRIAQKTCHLLDISGKILERRIISTQLLTGLCIHGVNVSEDCRTWKKDQILIKLAVFMGIEPHDPDPSYALTADNFIKILAIQMRFR